MKTAMQTLISKLKTEISELNKKIDKYSNDTGVYTGHKYGLDHALSVAEELLEMEKEQRGYSEEEVLEVFEHFKMDLPFHYEFLLKEHLQQLKQQEQ